MRRRPWGARAEPRPAVPFQNHNHIISPRVQAASFGRVQDLRIQCMSLCSRNGHRHSSAVSTHRSIPSPLQPALAGSAADADGSSASAPLLKGRDPTYRRAPLSPPTSHEIANGLLLRESSQHIKRFDSADYVLEIAEEMLQKVRLNLARMRCDPEFQLAQQVGLSSPHGHPLGAAPFIQ